MSASPKQKLKYAWRALQLNPAMQGEQIVKQRLIALGLVEESTLSRGSTEQRVQIRQQLDELRDKFWVTHPEYLVEQLDGLNVAPYPELKVSVARMRKLCEVKPLVEKLSMRKKKDINFINTFKRIFLLPPREAGKVKERYLRNLATNQAIDMVQSTVRTIQEKYPQLYEVESDWFGQILRIQSRYRVVEPDETETGVYYDDDGFEIPVYLIIVLGVFALRIAAMVFRSSQ